MINKEIKIEVFSLFGFNSKQPIVQLGVEKENNEPLKIQMTPKKAREIAQNLLECAEASEQDAFIYKYFSRHGLEPEKIAQVLDDFRKERLVFDAEQLQSEL